MRAASNDAPLIGAYMARHALIPDRVMVSTSERTRETWQRLADALAAVPPVDYEERLYNAGSETILALAKHIEPPVRTLLVIGHNPGLHDLARLLIASGDVEARERLNEGLPTSGLAVIDFAGSGLGQGCTPAAAGSNVSSAPARSRPPTRLTDRRGGALMRSDAASRPTAACAPSPVSIAFAFSLPAWQYDAKPGRERDSAMYRKILVPIDLADHGTRQARGRDRPDDGAVFPTVRSASSMCCRSRR